ncbi:MAG: putative enzyme related to lactoylglutathione lyase [Halieaceae bacterium]
MANLGFGLRRALALSAFCVVGLVAACTSVQYNLPPVAIDTDGARHPGKFIWHDLISDTPRASQAFYTALLGWEFQSLRLTGAEYWLITHGGQPIGGMVNQARIPAGKDVSQWVSVLSVADIAAATGIVTESGGTVLRQPVSVGDRGDIAVFADPTGAIFAALQSRDGDPGDEGAPIPEGAFLWHELWTADVDGAAEFYAALCGLDIERGETAGRDGQSVAYHLLRDDALARSGVRDLPLADLPPLWMPYLRVADAAALESLLERIPGLGGRVLVPSMARPAGGFLAVIAGPSGAPIALQTWGDKQPRIKAG